MAIPIRVEVSDANLAEDRLQYFILAEVPSAAAFERLKQLDEERSKQLAARQAQVAQRAEQTINDARAARGNELADVRRRMEALEQRLDLITRQLNEVLKKLDKE